MRKPNPLNPAFAKTNEPGHGFPKYMAEIARTFQEAGYRFEAGSDSIDECRAEHRLSLLGQTTTSEDGIMHGPSLTIYHIGGLRHAVRVDEGVTHYVPEPYRSHIQADIKTSLTTEKSILEIALDWGRKNSSPNIGLNLPKPQPKPAPKPAG